MLAAGACLTRQRRKGREKPLAFGFAPSYVALCPRREEAEGGDHNRPEIGDVAIFFILLPEACLEID